MWLRFYDVKNINDNMLLLDSGPDLNLVSPLIQSRQNLHLDDSLNHVMNLLLGCTNHPTGYHSLYGRYSRAH
jgi:hypothetical protein